MLQMCLWGSQSEGGPGAPGYWSPHHSNPREALSPFYSLLKRGEILREKKSKECEKTGNLLAQLTERKTLARPQLK